MPKSFLGCKLRICSWAYLWREGGWGLLSDSYIREGFISEFYVICTSGVFIYFIYFNNNKLYLHDYKYIQYCKSVKLN